MNDQTKSPPAQHPEHSLAKTFVDSIIDRLVGEAIRRGGSLSVKDLGDLRGMMEGDTANLEAQITRSFRQFASARERANWDQARRYPFDRLLVKTFSHILLGEEGMTLSRGGLPRRFLPGFFLAITKMLGEENVERLHGRTRVIVNRLKEKDGTVDWETVYADPDSQELVIESLVDMAPYFSVPERRKAWMEDLINSHMAATNPDDRTSRETEGWQFGGPAFFKLTEAMFASLNQALANHDQRKALESKLGDKAIAAARAALGELEAARKKG
ncbi:MAG: hypothetical protein OQJ99_10845 [Rhodospirillales bacterium]|nr:hypothetical protein [Rhodospirillales bacterium]MCW8860790.1 hypothetical protein [Rhodospirillales bacterium]MCW8951248.1 hypothetical protein [Rhodospirillales bacterium]MCW9040940.1 hypothetical protein [Rhodospirillales bacterium]